MKVFAWARKPGWWAPARDLASTAILIVNHPQAMRIDFQLEQGAGRFRSRHDLGPARFTRLTAGIEQVGKVDLAELVRSEEHTSELQSLMRISYAVFCLKKKKLQVQRQTYIYTTKEEK